MNQIFRKLSMALCADTNLSASLSDEYFEILAPDVNFLPLLNAYSKILNTNPSDILIEIQNQLLTNSDYKLLIKEIIKLWYLGKTERKGINELKGKSYYFHYEALIWKVLHTHPAGLTGGYFGYWSYKPEN